MSSSSWQGFLLILVGAAGIEPATLGLEILPSCDPSRTKQKHVAIPALPDFKRRTKENQMAAFKNLNCHRTATNFAGVNECNRLIRQSSATIAPKE
jgi:hypothetical protein